MNPFAVRGTKVRYIGCLDCQVEYRGWNDPRPLLTEGEIYLVDQRNL
jgi:hypothetical protein